MDLSDFDKSVMDLFEVCKEIIKTSESRNLSLSGRKNPIMTRLEKYMKTYSKTDPEEHVVYFERIFNDNKRFILLGPQRDSWLNDGNLTITFGEDCGLKTDIKLHLSMIYNTACKMRDEIRDEVDGLPDAIDTKETMLPSKYMLVLYKIFREIASSETDKEKLRNHIESLGEKVGTRSSEDNGLSSIFEMASGMAEQVTGKKLPKDKIPGKNDIGKMMSQVLDNPQTKSMLGSVMEGLKDTNNIQDILGKLMGGLGGMAGNQKNEETPEIESVPEEGDVNDEFDDYEE